MHDLFVCKFEDCAHVQVLSICETQWQYANVVIISPDSGETELMQCKLLLLRLCMEAHHASLILADNLSILQAAVRGVDLRRHRESTICCGQGTQAQTALLAVLSAAAHLPELQLPDRACTRQPRSDLSAHPHP